MVTEDGKVTIREELDLFTIRADEFIESKYILADIKIVNILKAIASSNTLIALFKNCLTNFDYEQAKKKYLVKSQYLSSEKGEFVMPPNSRELLAFTFNLLVDIDAKNIDFGDFVSKYFYVDGSFSSGYDLFINSIIKPFKNSVKMLMESVIDGKLQDPVEALVEQETRREQELKLEQERAKKEQELLKNAYGKSLKAIREILLEDKTKIKLSKLDAKEKKDIVLVIDMLANAMESEEKDAIVYAFVAYKYVVKAHPMLLRGRLKKVSVLLKDIINEI